MKRYTLILFLTSMNAMLTNRPLYDQYAITKDNANSTQKTIVPTNKYKLAVFNPTANNSNSNNKQQAPKVLNTLIMGANTTK